MSEEQTAKDKAKPAANAKAKPAAKAGAAGAKKAKPPKVEDKPFADFMHQDYLPALKSALTAQGVGDIEVMLEKQKFPMSGLGSNSECWQVIGRWNQGKRQFNIYFPEADISGHRAFSCSDVGAKPSTLEPFLIDERKITLDLMVFGVIQRLNGQKWLTPN